MVSPGAGLPTSRNIPGGGVSSSWATTLPAPIVVLAASDTTSNSRLTNDPIICTSRPCTFTLRGHRVATCVPILHALCPNSSPVSSHQPIDACRGSTPCIGGGNIPPAAVTRMHFVGASVVGWRPYGRSADGRGHVLVHRPGGADA